MPRRTNSQADLSALLNSNPVYDIDNVYLHLTRGWTYRHYKNATKTEYWDEVLVAGPALLANGDPDATAAVDVEGAVASVSITNGGTGYSVGDGIATTTAGSGLGLIVNVTAVDAGVITAVEVAATPVEKGNGYAEGDTVTVTTGGGDAELTINTISTLPPTAPTFLLGDGAQMPVDRTYLVEILTGGSGYSAALGVATTSSGSGTLLTVNTTIGDGEGSAPVIVDAGTGFTAGTDIATTGGNGTLLTVDITETGGVIDTITINNPGAGYHNGDTLTVSGGTTGGTFTITADGDAIVGIELVDLGSGYVDGEVITVTGGGADATFSINIL